MWEYMRQLHEARVVYLVTAGKEDVKRPSAASGLGQEFVTRGHVLLLGLTASGVQLRRQLGDVYYDDGLTPQQQQLVNAKLAGLVCGKSCQAKASFEQQFSEPLFKLRSVFNRADKEGGGEMHCI
jgi:hypothetical protein